MNRNVTNIAERVLWTFLQAAIGSLPATFALTGNNLRAVGYSALTAGVAAAISLAKNLSLTTPVVTPVTVPHPPPVLGTYEDPTDVTPLDAPKRPVRKK